MTGRRPSPLGRTVILPNSFREVHLREPRCFSWRISGLVILAAAIAGNLILIL